tara:strand:+ start:125 stop:424 length:300 start_codon:yes stop_codon:yes gene_type:complete
MKFILIIVFLVINLSSCQTVTKKIDEKVTKEEAQLSKWLNKSEEELKIEFGKPNQIEFKDNSRNRFYIYTKEKLRIKCERIFEINPGNKVVGFTSKNCF